MGAMCDQGGWVLVADWGGKILQRVTAKGGFLEYTQTEYSAVQNLTEEEAGDFSEEQERELQAAAAIAARRYARNHDSNTAS